MNRNNRRVLAWIAGLPCVVMGLSASPTSAAIIGRDANVATMVQELIDGSPASVTSDSDQLDATSSNLPLTASGNLVSTDLEGVLVSMGQAFSAFSDPTRLDQPNPEEFAMEVACYSNTDGVDYTVTSSAQELRTVVFTTAGSTLAPPEIDFGLGSTRDVESRVFLSGAVILWSTATGLSLDEMLADLSVSVVREDTDVVLFETTLRVTGESTDQVETTSTGPILFEVVGLDDLIDEGVDDDSIAILERVEQQGTLVVLVIPPQEHPYTYTVTADEPFDVRAALDARVRNVPGGTGMAATWGAPFENLADFIAEGLPGVDGGAVEQSINKVTASRSIGLVASAETADCQTGTGLCGALGFECLGVLAAGLVLMLGRSRY